MTETPMTREEDSQTTATEVCEHQDAIDRLRSRLNASLLGKEDVVEMVLVCLLARGHIHSSMISLVWARQRWQRQSR